MQLTYARVDYDTFCTFLSEAFEKNPDEQRYSPELHTALVNIAGLVVIPFEEQYVYDYDGPYGWTADPPVKTWGHYDEARLKRAYGIGFEMLPACGKGKDVDQVLKEFKEKSSCDMLRIWGRHGLSFE